MFCGLFCKSKAARTQTRRVGTEEGRNRIVFSAFGRVTQRQTRPPPKGNAEASDINVAPVSNSGSGRSSRWPLYVHPKATYISVDEEKQVFLKQP